jgi:hypothetical protein
MNYIYFYTIDGNVLSNGGLIKFEDVEKTNFYIHSYTKIDNAIKSSFLNIGDNSFNDIKYYIAQGNALRLKPDYSKNKDKDFNKNNIAVAGLPKNSTSGLMARTEYGTVELRMGGWHVMLMELNQALNAGDEVDMTLEFSNGETLTFKAPVKAIAMDDEKYGAKGGM